MGILLWLILGSAALGAGDGGAAPPAGKTPVVSRIDIRIESGRGDMERWRSAAASLIFFAEGKPYSDALLRKSLTALEAAMVFETIDVPDPEWTEGGVSLTFRLTPFRRIRSVRFEGAFPVFEREVRNAMTLQPGGRYIEARIPEEEASVTELFKANGYVDPVVRISVGPDEREGLVNLRVRIEKGTFLRVERFEIEGARAFSEFRLKLRTDAWKKSLLFGEIQRFVRKDLDEDVKNLLKFYRAKGYADASVEARVDEIGDNAVDVRIRIHEGPRYVVSFEGNEAYLAWWTLRRDLAIEGGNRNDLGLRKSLRNIRRRYQSGGYLDSRVTLVEPEEEALQEGRRDIRIRIDEGPQSIVREIGIEGNEAVGDDRIEKQMLTRTPGIFASGAFEPRRLKDDIDAIKALYFMEGYRQTAVESRMDWEAEGPESGGSDVSPLRTDGSRSGDRHGKLTLDIDEGVRTRVNSLSITGVSSVDLERVREVLRLKPGDPFREHLLQEDEDAITGFIAEQGYPFVEVKGEAVLSTDDTGADVAFTVSRGHYVETGEVYFTGNFRTAEEILRNELEIRPGEPFSARRILESQRNIQDMGAVDSARIRAPGLKEQPDTAALFVEIEEKKPYWMEVSLGYDTERHLFASAKGGDRNLFGRNKDLRAGVEVSQIGYRVDASFTEPRFWQSRISATSTLFAEKREEFNQEFGTRNFGVSQMFNRWFLDEDLNLGLAFRLERREQYMRDGRPVPEGEEDLYIPRTVFVTTPSVVYNTTDSFTRPTRGIYASIFVDISTGLQETLDNFLKYQFETRYYITPVERLTFALRGRYGYLYPYGSDGLIPDDQLFFLGGTATVRGFDENLLRVDAEGKAVGGQEALLGNIEARYDLGMNFELAVFYDLGAVRRAEERGGDDDFRSSVGMGLRYITPIGAVGLLYGRQLDPREGEDAGRIHFSIGYTF